MINYIRILVVVLCLPGGLLAHTGSITGTVTDSLSGKAISYTNVFILNTGLGTVVDDHGIYIIENIPECRFLNLPSGENHIPLAPIHTSMGGVTYKRRGGLSLSFRYRYVSDRPANEDNSVTALGSLIWDLATSYRLNHLELYIKMENITNEEWNEAQFDTESRLKGPDADGNFKGTLESNSVSELHYTPGSPLFIRGGLVFYL